MIECNEEQTCICLWNVGRKLGKFICNVECQGMRGELVILMSWAIESQTSEATNSSH